MAFFKTFQQNLPSVSSLVDTISNAVEDLTAAVGEVGYTLTDSVAEQVTNMINGFRPEEESSAVAEVVADASEQANAVSPEFSKDTNCQKTQSSLEHRANRSGCYNTLVSQKQDQGMNEERVSTHIDDRQQSPPKPQDSSNAGSDSSLKGHLSDGGISVIKQNARAGSASQELERTDRCKKIGLGIPDNGKNLKEVRSQEMKENHLKKAEKHTKSKGSKGNEWSGNECSPKDILASNRHTIQKPTVKEDIHPALSANSRDKLHGKIKEQINPTAYYKVKGDIKIKKNEAISAHKGTARSKDEKYSKLIPGKGEVS